MTSGSSADTTMTFGVGEITLPAAGESTAEDPVAGSVDSTTTEEDKAKTSSSMPRKPPRKAKSL